MFFKQPNKFEPINQLNGPARKPTKFPSCTIHEKPVEICSDKLGDRTMTAILTLFYNTDIW